MLQQGNDWVFAGRPVAPLTKRPKSSQGPAALFQTDDDWQPDQGGEVPRRSLRKLPTGAAPLFQSRDPPAAKAHAGARGSWEPGLQQVRPGINPISARPNARVGGLGHY